MESRRVPADHGATLHVGVSGEGHDVLVLSGGPGCVHYLEHDHLVPPGVRAWHPEPRGVGRSSGGTHGLAEAVADLEAVRRAAGVASWTVLGHSWGCDLAMRYALDHPTSVERVVGVAGRGLQQDRSWSRVYEELEDTEPEVTIDGDPAVHESLKASFSEWIHEPDLWRRLADCPVPMGFYAAELDIRLPWPLQQLAALVPTGSYEVVPGVPHNFWSTHPDVWVATVARALEGPDRSSSP